MALTNQKGINIQTGLETEGHNLKAHYKDDEILSLPFKKIANTALYNNVDIAIDIPFDDYLETDDVCCELRFFIPPVVDADIEAGAGKDFTLANQIHNDIKKKANLEENVSELIVSQPDQPLVVPRGKYIADLYKTFLKLHGQTFNYTIHYKNIVKAFLQPQPDNIHMSFVLGFDKPLRQGSTSYPFLIFQFKSDVEESVEQKLPEEELKEINPQLLQNYSGNYYEIVAKLFKMITGINIIIPGEFKTTSNHHALRCNVGSQEGHLFPLNKSLIFQKKPVIYMRVDEIARVEFQRVASGLQMRNFDFEIILKNSQSFSFSSVDKKELEKLMAYFNTKQILVKTVEETAKIVDDMDDDDEDEESEAREDGKRKRKIKEVDEDDLMDDEDESEDEDFVANDDNSSSDDGDFQVDEKNV